MRSRKIIAILLPCCIPFAACSKSVGESAQNDQAKAGAAARQPRDVSAASVQKLAALLDKYLDEQVAELGMPGLSVAVVRDGKVIYAGARGVRKLGERDTLTPRNVFHFASVSKTFVATAVMQLVERGKLKLDDKVATILPYFRLADERYRDITIRQMLSHTAGLPPGNTYDWDHPQFDEGAAERYVRSLTSERLLWAPGTEYQYSDLGFDIMGDVIAKVSDQSFEVFVKSNILAPLGMASSSFIYLELDSALRTTGHVDDPARVSDVFPYNRRHAPSSTLNSSVIDMTRWMLANLNRGELEGRRILQPASYDVLWAPTVRIPDKRYPGGHVGLSWFVKEIAGRRTVFHAGGDVGFRSFVLLAPDERIGVVLASNWQLTPRETLAEDIFDTVLRSSPATKSGRSPTKEQR